MAPHKTKITIWIITPLKTFVLFHLFKCIKHLVCVRHCT